MKSANYSEIFQLVRVPAVSTDNHSLELYLDTPFPEYPMSDRSIDLRPLLEQFDEGFEDFVQSTDDLQRFPSTNTSNDPTPIFGKAAKLKSATHFAHLPEEQFSDYDSEVTAAW